MPCHLATPLCSKAKHKVRAGALAPALRLIYVGWVMGLEPTTPGTTIRCSNQLSYTHHVPALTGQGEVARLKGLEPLTHCLEGSCSIHLSYRRIWSG